MAVRRAWNSFLTGGAELPFASRATCILFTPRFQASLSSVARLLGTQLPIERFAVEAQDAGGGGLVAADGFENMLNVAAFDFFHGQQLYRVVACDDDLIAAVVTDLFRQVFDGELFVASECDGVQSRFAILARFLATNNSTISRRRSPRCR